ncbi:MAG: protein kinase [Polyangiales bacterium]
MQIGSYQVLFELGRGGMGTVYLGRVRGTGDFERLVAIKRQRALELGFDEPPERLLTEARLAGLIHHANVVGMHQAGSDSEGYYFVCDYVEGLSLAGLLGRHEPHALWPVGIVTRVMLDALAGLQAVHDAVDAEGHALGMLHRDLATDNLLVGRDGVTRLADFGIAKTVRGMPRTEEGQVRGKLPYLAPEYLRGEPVDLTFDLYAAGVTLWVALSRRLPWGELSEVHMMQAIVSEGLPSLPAGHFAAGSELEAVIARACHPHARERYRSAREMLDALEAAASRVGTIARHVQVAEYVEQVAGAELAARRARIQAHRRALDAGLPPPIDPIAPSVHAGGDAASDAPTALSRVPTLRRFAPPSAPRTRTSTPAPRFTPPTPVRRFTPPDPPVSKPVTVRELELEREPAPRRLALVALLVLLATSCIASMFLAR